MGKGVAVFPGAHVWPLPLTGSGSSHLLRECVSSGHQVPFPGVLGPLFQKGRSFSLHLLDLLLPDTCLLQGTPVGNSPTPRTLDWGCPFRTSLKPNSDMSQSN